MEQHPIKINKVQIRNLQIEDYAQLSQSFTRVYSDGSDVFWTHKQIQKLINIFPEGQIVTVVDDKIVGCALSISQRTMRNIEPESHYVRRPYSELS